LIYDPRKGDTIRERLSLQGNPAVNDDWWLNPKTGEVVDFIDFCRSEGRFGKHFDKDGNPSETLLRAKADRLENWRLLQELAGVLGKKKPEAKPAGEKPKPAAIAKPAAKPQAATNGSNGHQAEIKVGSRFKYKDGAAWVPGVVTSVEPAILELEDGTEIRTTVKILQNGLADGLIAQV
jgi:hypothetical protein